MEKVANVMELLLERPDAFKVIEEAQRQLQEEQARRMQFYDNLDESVKAEFINGELVVHSPVRSRHAAVSDNVFSLIRTFAMKHKLGRATHEKVMSRFTRNDYEPDVMFFKNEKAATITPMQALFPVPDLVVEIVSNATENRDRGVKFKDYAAHGVEEYWIVDAETQIIEQYHLEKGDYTLIKKTDEGTIHAFVLPHLDVPVLAIFDEHANFIFIQQLLTTAL